MKIKANILPKIIVFIICLLVFAAYFPHQAKPTEVGVRVVKWSLFEKMGTITTHEPGATYFFPPVINEWYTFDTKLHNMEMTVSEFKGARQGRDDLVFKTIDGNDIALDVIIAYRIDRQKAPYILTNIAQSDRELEEKLVRPTSRNITRELFGELKTEDFYVTNKRTEKAELVKKALNAMLGPHGVIVESVLPKDYRFKEAYQRAIEDKKVADQMAERFKSETKATVEEYRQKLQMANGEVNKMVADVDGEYQKAKINADAYYEQETMIAQAIEVEGDNQAKGIQKMVEALNNAGGLTMVKIKLAEALAGKKIYLLPFGDSGGIDLKTTNINELLQIYGLKSLE